MKIALITPWAVKCGIYTYSRDLSEALADAGVDVYVVRLPRFGIKTPDIMKLVADSVPEEVDLVHVQHEYGLFKNLEGVFYGVEGLKSHGKPVISTLHAIGNFNVDPILAKHSDVLVTHNEFCSKRLGHPNVIIPHGCAPAKCLPSAEAKKSYGLRPEWPIVGSLGFISNYKNLEILIEAMEKIPQAGLLIGGGWHTAGAETRYIEDLKRDSFETLPGRVQWLGYVKDEDLPRAYGVMDIFVYPSRMATESGALLTALGYGKAVVASRLKPFQEKEREGALVTFKGVNSLRRRIRKLIRDGDARRELEEGARLFVEKRTWKKVAKLHVSLYDTVIEDHTKKSIVNSV